MHKFLLVIALLTTAATAAFAQTTAKSAEPDNSVEKAVLRVTQQWLDADEKHDRAALDQIIARRKARPRDTVWASAPRTSRCAFSATPPS